MVALSQSVRVRGSVSTAGGSVRSALVTFLRTSDTTAKATTLTDSLGNFAQDIITSTRVENSKPINFRLVQNYPNPFSSVTAISYALSQHAIVTVRIYNILGQLLREFNVGMQTPGSHGIIWDGTATFGRRAAAGIYFCQLTVAGETQVRKMVLADGMTDVGRPSFTQVSQFAGTSAAVQGVSATGGVYTIRLQSTDSTTPPIATKEYESVFIRNDTTVNLVAEEVNDFVLCYSRAYQGHGQIFLNNIKGTHPRKISVLTAGNDDGYPRCSPDGRYIAYRRLAPLYSPFTIVYDTKLGTHTDVTSDGGLSASLPRWTPDGRVFFAYQRPVGSLPATYLMNPDGSGKTKILDSVASGIFFYNDSYRFVYIQRARVYIANIAGTQNEFICDLEQLLNQYVAVQGFDPVTEGLLLSYKSEVDSLNRIATYNVHSRTITDLLTAPKGYDFFQIGYSADCAHVYFVEHSEAEEYLSVLEAGGAKRLVRIPKANPHVAFSFNPFQFSPDGKYLAYSKQVWEYGPYVVFRDYLYTVEIANGIDRFVDAGWDPSWFASP